MRISKTVTSRMLFLCLAFALAFNACVGKSKGTSQNPIPSINSLTPVSGIAGSASLTITINGSGFIAGSIARWNGSNRTTTFVGNAQLTALISASDIAAAGTAQVLVFNPTPGGGTSSAVAFPINNPVPIVSSLNPSSQVVGGPSFTLTVNGSNFLPSSEVRWNGASRATTFVGRTQLTALISASDIDALGTAQVLVFNPVPGGGTSNALNFWIRNPAPTISMLNPLSQSAGGSAFTLTANGSNFSPSSVVLWNGSNRATTFVSSKQLTAAITVADIASTGTAQVQVADPDGGTSGAAAFVITSYPSEWVFLGVPTVNGISYPDVLQIAVDPEDQRILYLAVDQSGLFVSRDGGASWKLAVAATHPGMVRVGMIAQDPNAVDRVFYGQDNNLYVSTDRGLTWDLASTLDSTIHFVSLAVSKLDAHTLFGGVDGSNGTFYRSQDDGASWQSFSFGQTIGLDNFIPWAVAEDPIDGTLYVGVELGNHPQPYRPPFLRSMDGGATWKNLVETATSQEGPVWHVIKIVIHPTNHKVFALTEGAGLYASTDHGSTWTRTTKNVPNCELVMDPTLENRFFGGLLYYSTSPGGTLVSIDGAETFSSFGLEGRTACSLAPTGDSSYLFAAAYPSGIYVTPLPVEGGSMLLRSEEQRQMKDRFPIRQQNAGFHAVSKDGRTGTVAQEGKNAKGQEINNTIVYDKQ